MSYISKVASPVSLRRATLDDGAALAALLTPEISRWVADWPDTMDETVARERIGRELADAADGSSLPLIVEMVGEGQAPIVAGWFRLRLAAHDRDLAVMSCWLGRHFQGQGVGRHAVAAAARLALPELGASRIGAYTMRSNAKSIRALQESGLAYVGERAVPLPARGRIEVLLCFEREAHGALPVQAIPLPMPVAA